MPRRARESNPGPLGCEPSVLPLLYAVYIYSSGDKLKLISYADGTTVFLQGNNITSVRTELNSELDK